jgi:hypothetical protein
VAIVLRPPDREDGPFGSSMSPTVGVAAASACALFGVAGALDVNIPAGPRHRLDMFERIYFKLARQYREAVVCMLDKAIPRTIDLSQRPNAIAGRVDVNSRRVSPVM